MLTLAREQRRSRPATCVLLQEGPVGEMLTDHGLDVEYAYTKARRPRSLLTRVTRAAAAIRRAARATDAQLIHCHSLYGAKYAAVGAWRAGLPWIGHVRDNFVANRSVFGSGSARAVVSISHHIEATLPPSLQRKSTVVHNAVPLPDDAPGLEPQELSGRPMVFGMAGRAVEDKGFDLLLDAARGWPHGAARLILWGLPARQDIDSNTDPYVDRLYRIADALDVEVDAQPFRTDVENFYREADVVVVPSRYAEPFGRMAIEAMAYGKPPIVAAHGGLTEIVTHGEDGLRFSPNDTEALREQLETLRRDPAKAASLGRTGRETVNQRFSAGAHCQAIEAVYRTIVKDV